MTLVRVHGQRASAAREVKARVVAPEGGQVAAQVTDGRSLKPRRRGEKRVRVAQRSSRARPYFSPFDSMITNLRYAIRRSPVSQKALSWALQAQAKLNEKLSWQHDRLNLAPVVGAAERPPLGFPFVRVAPLRIGPYAVPDPYAERTPSHASDAFALGATKTRSLFGAHVVGSFLRSLSNAYPECVIELEDESGQFVLPMGVLVRAGRFELNAQVLNAQRARVLEMTGDPQAAAPFLWAEAQALNGQVLADGPATECAELPEVRGLDLDPEVFEQATIGDIANFFVSRLISETAPVAN